MCLKRHFTQELKIHNLSSSTANCLSSLIMCESLSFEDVSCSDSLQCNGTRWHFANKAKLHTNSKAMSLPMLVTQWDVCLSAPK